MFAQSRRVLTSFVSQQQQFCAACRHYNRIPLFSISHVRHYAKSIPKDEKVHSTEDIALKQEIDQEELEEFLQDPGFQITIEMEEAEKKLTANMPEPETPFDGVIPKEKLTIKYARAGGPGGQNVNKVSTKADVRFNIDQADWLPPIVKQRLKILQAHRVNAEGELVVQASVHRTQEQNVKDAIQRIKTLVVDYYAFLTFQ